MFDLIETLKTRIAEHDERVRAAIKRQRAAIEVFHDEMEPTLDADGRFHAPCDGYVYPVDIYGETRTFAAGSYLPEFNFDEDGEWIPPSGRTVLTETPRVKLPASVIVELAELLDGVPTSIKNGKVWEANEPTAYAYIYGSSKTLTHGIHDIVAQWSQEYYGEEKQRQIDTGELKPVIEGRGPITGTVLGVKVEDDFYGRTYKMLIEDDRKFKLWGTIPTAIWEAVNDLQDLVKQRVAFTATVAQSQNDETFGIFKRPAKAQLITTNESAA